MHAFPGCNTTTLTWEVHFCKSGIYPGYNGPSHIWRSSGQGHRSKNGPLRSQQKFKKYLFPQCKTLIGNKAGSVKGKGKGKRAFV